jgi:hypothetical protein
MRLRPLLWMLLVACAAISLARALLTTDGVGPFEYLVGIVLVAALALAAVRAARRAVSHT